MQPCWPCKSDRIVRLFVVLYFLLLSASLELDIFRILCVFSVSRGFGVRPAYYRAAYRVIHQVKGSGLCKHCYLVYDNPFYLALKYRSISSQLAKIPSRNSHDKNVWRPVRYDGGGGRPGAALARARECSAEAAEMRNQSTRAAVARSVRQQFAQTHVTLHMCFLPFAFSPNCEVVNYFISN